MLVRFAFSTFAIWHDCTVKRTKSLGDLFFAFASLSLVHCLNSTELRKRSTNFRIRSIDCRSRIFVLHAWFKSNLNWTYRFHTIQYLKFHWSHEIWSISWDLLRTLVLVSLWIASLRAANAGNCGPCSLREREKRERERSEKKLIFHLEKLRRKLKNHLSSNARHISNVENKLEN